MSTIESWQLADIEQRVCDVTAVQLGMRRAEVQPESRLIEDLNCDSLDLIELLMEVEESFDVTLPEKPTDPVYKSVFTRSPFRMSDLAQLVYLRRGSGHSDRRRRRRGEDLHPDLAVFSQLGGQWRRVPGERLLEPLSDSGQPATFRRHSDGMRCVLVAGGTVEIGSDAADTMPDERPRHTLELDTFIIDAEPVSTTAYCRFLNSIEASSPHTLADWFVLAAADNRRQYMPIEQVGDQWRPLPVAERWPMILVSWYGANAYALWAAGRDWRDYAVDDPDAECFLPSEAQWEYAARGATKADATVGAYDAEVHVKNSARHSRARVYTVEDLPLADVHARLGMSPLGLHHMAGNVWQWCRDWYDANFYRQAAARSRNAINREPTGVRSERGGSWVGPAELCRSSYRRGRAPQARGRCLGFRCITPWSELPKRRAK